MQIALKQHPDGRPIPMRAIDVDVRRTRAGVLWLRYRVIGAVSQLCLAPTAAPLRTDNLWRHTCFEAFIRTPDGRGYCEFNFSPSSQWAAYRFAGYREGMSELADIPAPKISAQSDANRFELEVLLDVGGLPDLPAIATWGVGLSAVIEDIGGDKAYWALAHAPGKPDFHHDDGFACQVSVGERP